MVENGFMDEASARKAIVEAGRRMYERGLVSGGDGNLSARISGGVVIATPGGASKGFMDEDMLVMLDLSGNVLSCGMTPSSEIKMHLAIYGKSPGIRAVCHAHPPVAAAFAAAGVALDKPYLQETVMFLGTIPVAKYAPPGTQELADGVAGLCLQYRGALLEHHGAVTWGSSIMESLYRMESVEYTATVAMYSKMMGFTRTLDEKQVEGLTAMRNGN